jgi:thimet oligopeptidase
LLADPARETIRIAQRDGDEREIHQERDDCDDQADAIDQNEQCRQQRRPGDEWHAERNNAEFIATASILRSDPDQLANGQDEQDQSAGHLKIRDRDPECRKNYLAEKNKNDRDAKRGEDSEERLTLSMFGRGGRAEPHKNSDQPDRIDRDEDRNKREKEFFDHGIIGCVFALPANSSTQSSLFRSTKPFRMKTLYLSLFLFALMSNLCAEELKTVDDFRAAAKKANAVLTIPDWEQTPDAVDAAMKDAIATANKALDQIGTQDLSKVTFKSTIVALDDLTYQAANAANKATIIKETSTNEKMRSAAENAVKIFQDWVVGLDYREDVYKALKAFADTNPKLSGEDAKLLFETMRDYRRAGLGLPPEKRKEVEQLRKELSKLGTDFDTNIVSAQAPVVFTKVELDGVPESFFASPGIKTGEDAYTVKANVTWQFVMVEENAKSEATRKRLYVIHDSLAKDTNVLVLNQMLALRNKIALLLGYKSWDDFQTEIKMAKSGAGAKSYIDRLISGIQPKFDSEVSTMQKMKAADVNDPNAKIDVWDWRYYDNQLKKQEYAVDKEALRNYFPFQKVLDGMFAIYQSIFGLKFEKIAAPYKWIDDLQLYLVTDSTTGEPLGMFYLDMFPRDGKFNHFAEFEIVGGKLLSDGKYQRPTVALLCNFPPPSADKPSLMAHSDVETLFHEFGHALHSITTRAHYGRFAGTHVPGDFVEAPSQMLQNWVWDKKVLDTFAADYRDPAKKIPAEIVKKMNDAKLATAGVFYRRQFAFASLDLALHDSHPENGSYDCVAISNPILEKVFLPIDPSTTFVSYFGHLNGYDAGYYGYAWADAIAADMATVFEKAKDGYLDRQAGLKLRREIYEQGDSRGVALSIEKFLGRKQSIQPFLKKLGIGTQEKKKTPADRPQESR